MVRANRRITLEEIEDGLNEDCSHFSVHKIVSETLGYRKVSASSSGPQSTFDFKSSQTTYCRYSNSTYRMALPPLSSILILFFNIFSTNNPTIVTKHCNLIQDHRTQSPLSKNSYSLKNYRSKTNWATQRVGVSIRRFVGHKNDVTSVSLSADNKVIASGSRDKTVKIWNTNADWKFEFEDYTEWISAPVNIGSRLVPGDLWDKFSKLKDIDFKLKDLDQKMLDHMMVADAEEDNLNCEIEEAEHYSDTFITLERKLQVYFLPRRWDVCSVKIITKDCITAQSMPFKDKRAKIYEKRCCLKCLKPGHLAKACKRTVQCNICAKGHYVLLCPDLPCNRKEKTHVSEVVQSALANQQCTRDVTLMTLMVNIMGNNGYRRVRALLDPGSQKSYILESTALEVKLEPIGNVNIAHSLFGGTQTETKCHKVYKVALCSNQSELDTLREFEFLGQDIICGEIPRTPKGAWLNELKGSRIWLSDLGRDSPKIELLIGSDIYGSLLSGRVKQLKNGLTALETHLGWTICGPSPKKDEQTDYSSLVVISMHSRNMSVDYLWDLETIGIKDPRENLTKLEEDKIVHQHFLNTVHQQEDGRFCDKGNLSLDDCLASGPNVIEQIPAILLKFREKAIGVIADIRKAFLQIEVKEEDRDYLRFLWWKNNHQIQVFRHKRVVFGVTCSPYLLGAVILHHLKGVSSEFGALPQKLMECLYIDNCVISVDTEAELVDLVEKSTEIFAKAKMDLRMWQFGPIHRVKEVYSRLPPSVDIERSEEVSVLGMKWNLLEDTLNVTPKFGVIINSLSKRDFLSHTQQIFDPIGFLALVLLPAKLLIQQAWTVKTDWDEPLPSTIQENFIKWYSMHSLQLSELEDAEKGIWKTVQQQVFSSRGDSINGLMIIRDDFGLIRIKSKLIERDDEYSFRYPILLPTKHHVVTCLIREFHLRHCHAGVQILSAKLGENYWILNSRRSIRSVVSQCAKCRRFSSKPVKTAPIHLPHDRVRDATAFEILGVDLAGPLYLKNKTKACIVLFTCAVFRAIHLELVTSLSTEAFIQALRRFIARRGRPTVIYSDNGTNFVGANNALKALNWKKIVLDQNLHKISWKFIPPTAAWWGGWWERLIRSIKDLLVRILGHSSVYYEEMSTILCDAEATINSRPLTYIHEDFDSLILLSPSMFLHDSKYVGVPDLDKLDSKKFQDRYRHCQRLREALRSRFRSEYLGQLVQKANERTPKLSVGDVVIVKVEDKRRLHWPMARIVVLFPGRDGHSRVAKVRTKLGTLIRPVQKLYPLEVSSGDPILRSKEDTTIEEEHSEAKRTRCGRMVKPPQRLNL
ncbi:hypothetical protein LAZ67_5002175 [Cordylochernes scorpioides]|uniref:Pro-Pol polyprotein n=1 Tax=Cordylochernes scorpioides TaxID=51811 RepID=A0ABY6KI14_9ARAC|nr:hypothetical protein LAZ67_5002175 [Cordylochernes scorpioides]